METPRNSNNKITKKIWNLSKFAPFLVGALFLKSPSLANAQNIPNQNKTQAEISTSTILDRLDKQIWISLPEKFNGKVLDFVLNDTIMKTKSATDYTEDFIANEIKKDRWINKQNQLLFIRSTIYEWISGDILYDRLDDENEWRWEEYWKALKQINESYDNYKTWFKTYMETKSAEYKQQSTDARQQSADAHQQSADAIAETMKMDTLWIKELIKFYNIYETNSNIIKDEEIKEAKDNAQRFIKDCYKFWIDYKALLIKEIWDKRKVEELLKFYEIE